MGLDNNHTHHSYRPIAVSTEKYFLPTL